MDNDPFEQSLRELLQEPAARGQPERVLERVLKTANRQTGAGALLRLAGRGVAPPSSKSAEYSLSPPPPPPCDASARTAAADDAEETTAAAAGLDGASGAQAPGRRERRVPACRNDGEEAGPAGGIYKASGRRVV